MALCGHTTEACILAVHCDPNNNLLCVYTGWF